MSLAWNIPSGSATHRSTSLLSLDTCLTKHLKCNMFNNELLIFLCHPTLKGNSSHSRSWVSWWQLHSSSCLSQNNLIGILNFLSFLTAHNRPIRKCHLFYLQNKPDFTIFQHLHCYHPDLCPHHFSPRLLCLITISWLPPHLLQPSLIQQLG